MQWSDIAGMLPPEFIKNGVENFGFEFYHRFIDMVDQCKRDKLDVGNVNSTTYLESPLKNGWIRQPIEMVPKFSIYQWRNQNFPFLHWVLQIVNCECSIAVQINIQYVILVYFP